MWGGGSGGGNGNLQSVGSGGGGAFVEASFNVSPSEVLFTCYGKGGMGSVHGTSLSFGIEDYELETAHGGSPGGGNGYGSGSRWAGGGGGGCSMIRRKAKSVKNKCLELLVVAGGGGGGGSRNGCPGSSGDDIAILTQSDSGTCMTPIMGNTRHKTFVDVRIGSSGSSQCGGQGGKSYGIDCCCKIQSQVGESWRGGDGSDTGEGGGGGIYGGGGGGYNTR